MIGIGLDGRSLTQRVAECIEFLKEQGYAVRGPFKRKTDVKTPAHLVRYFYDVLTKYRPDSVTMYGGNRSKDLVIAKDLISARVKSGCSKQRAIAESCTVIDLLFKYEDRLGLTFIVSSMSVLGQGKLSWVTERLLHINEGLDKQLAKDENEVYFQELFLKQSENVKQRDLDVARDKLDKILESHGKKEKS